MKYEIFYRRVTDGRAPQFIVLEDEYMRGGAMYAASLRDLEHQLYLQPDTASKFAAVRRIIKVGDVVLEKVPTPRYMIYTPTGAWATVSVISG